MLFWQRPDLVQQQLPEVDLPELQRLRAASAEQLNHPNYVSLPGLLERLPSAADFDHPLFVDLDSDHITIGTRTDVTDEQFSRLEDAIRGLHPWRKGPFRLFGFEIDAEWRSNLKWDRIKPALGDLRGRKILDVGCGNGYYMFRAAAHNPALVLGLDPSVAFFYAFELIQRFLHREYLQYERLGHEHLPLFDQAFDIAICMGIVYHHRSPLDILRNLREAIRVGGFAIIESQTLPGDGSLALFPEDRYAKARNVYFVPTRDCLINWIKRAGFKNVELVAHTRVTSDEQRQTPLMTYESLSDFLDPENRNLTVEGYPAPYRTVVRAERKFV
jgi:tRNA (mo5U34)-methyltransferase